MLNSIKSDFQFMGVLFEDLVHMHSNKNFYVLLSIANLSTFVLFIGLCIFLLNKRTLFLYIMAMELLLLGPILNFCSYLYLYDSLESELFIYYTLTVAVSESAFGLGLILRIFKNKGSLDPIHLNDLT